MTGWENERDHPLSCHWRPVAPDAYEILGLPPARTRAGAIVRAQIITEAFVVRRADIDSWISYSRREGFYTARTGRYWPPTYTYSTVVPAVDQLADYGLLDHERMPPGHRGQQSRFKASSELIKPLVRAPFAVIHDPREVIILRDKDGDLIDYGETERSSRLRHNVREINEAVLSAAIAMQGRTIREGDSVEIGEVRIGAASNRLHRVFNRASFSLGGRFYGPWWQNIPSQLRADITINGMQTVEMDFPRLHPTLMYAEAGKQMRGDPYDLPDWPRDLVKAAFNTLVNADTTMAAIRSIANDIRGAGAFFKAQALVSEIEAKHTPIAYMFGSGAGLRLMRRDSDMTERLLLRLVTVRNTPNHSASTTSASSREPRWRAFLSSSDGVLACQRQRFVRIAERCPRCSIGLQYAELREGAALAFDHNVGGHVFIERGGKCLKCGTTWANYTDIDSKTYQRPCPGKNPEPRERTPIPDDE